MKKIFLSFAVLAMSMAMFTSCSSDDDEVVKEPVITVAQTSENLTLKEGEAVTIAPTYANVDANTKYEWSVNNEVVSTAPELLYTPAEVGEYTIVLKVTNAGKTVSKEFTLVVTEDLRTLDFEAESWTSLIDTQ